MIILGHYQVTTSNEVGIQRVIRTSPHWRELGLSPQRFSHHTSLDIIEGFSSEARKKMLGIAGCLQTHRKVWEKISSQTPGYYLVSEDDCLPSNTFRFDLEALFRNPSLKGQFPGFKHSDDSQTGLLLQLGWTTTHKISLRRLGAFFYHLLRYRGPLYPKFVRHLAFGTHCYLIDPKMARFLLVNISSSHIPLDLQFISLSKNVLYQDLTIARSVKNLAYQEGIDSNIESSSPRSTTFEIKKIREYIESISTADCPRNYSFQNCSSMN